MSKTPAGTTKVAMHEAAESAKAHVEQATATAQEMGRAMMEKGMAGMAEFSKLFADMKMPAVGGMDTFLAAQRKNMEVLSAANRVALEGAQAVAKRHMEIMQQTMAEMTESMREMASPESPQAKAARQAEMLKTTYERAVAHMREIADLIQKSNAEAMDMLNHRFAEALDEVKKLAAKGSHTARH
jgi:phasin family protein